MLACELASRLLSAMLAESVDSLTVETRPTETVEDRRFMDCAAAQCVSADSVHCSSAALQQ